MPASRTAEAVLVARSWLPYGEPPSALSPTYARAEATRTPARVMSGMASRLSSTYLPAAAISLASASGTSWGTSAIATAAANERGQLVLPPGVVIEARLHSQFVPSVSATPRSDAAHRQALRFLVVGCCTVLVDFVCYRLLHRAGLPLTAAKTGSFIIATCCAYVLNRSYTFGADGGRAVAGRFAALYGCALLLNVGTNALALSVIPTGSVRIVSAFLCAQAVSSAFNFVGMRQLVFNKRSVA